MKIKTQIILVVVAGLFVASIPVIGEQYTNYRMRQIEQMNNRANSAMLQDGSLEERLNKALGFTGTAFAESVNCYSDMVNVLAYKDEWQSAWCYRTYSHIVKKL